MIKSLRHQDIKAETSLAKFLDSYFYNRLSPTKGSKLEIQRVEDKELQLKGVDVRIETDDSELLIDEKAAFYYSNAMIPTFAFELESIQKGHEKPVEGWFINDELITNYYMLVWPNIRCEQVDGIWIRKDLSSIKKSDFTIVEAMLVSRKQLRKQIEDYGFDKDYLVKYAIDMRKKYFKDSGRIEIKLSDGVKIVYSGNLAEKSINLVVSKEKIKKSAKGIYLISEDGYATIKG